MNLQRQYKIWSLGIKVDEELENFFEFVHSLDMFTIEKHKRVIYFMMPDGDCLMELRTHRSKNCVMYIKTFGVNSLTRICQRMLWDKFRQKYNKGTHKREIEIPDIQNFIAEVMKTKFNLEPFWIDIIHSNGKPVVKKEYERHRMNQYT